MTDHRRNGTLGAALLWLAVPATALPALADPYDYRDHRDTITSSAGNASAANSAIQTIDPWPHHARNPRINLDGKRAGIAITRYQQNRSIDPKGLESTPVEPTLMGQSGTSITK